MTVPTYDSNGLAPFGQYAADLAAAKAQREAEPDEDV